MTVAGLVTALVVGVAIGSLRRFIVPGRQEVPIWLTVAGGVVAALAGTIVAQLAGISTGPLNVLSLIVQIGFAVIGVALVVATATPGGSHSARTRTGVTRARGASATTERKPTRTKAA
ncbi:GlsB/YeaQ/YmgE family stress response membrane protein [Micromonospora sp. NPDC005413]|uniref:GlsB/YeaQ/YmgE family stress response membrane protein n=1 Tax=Micromonospora sp. NPDC005413 TaxID=3154563 RepID=UPI0033A49CDD